MNEAAEVGTDAAAGTIARLMEMNPQARLFPGCDGALIGIVRRAGIAIPLYDEGLMKLELEKGIERVDQDIQSDYNALIWQDMGVYTPVVYV